MRSAGGAAGGGAATGAVGVEPDEGGVPGEKCVHELFEEQVERTPEAVAVVYEETAAELWGAEPRGPTSWRITCASWE